MGDDKSHDHVAVVTELNPKITIKKNSVAMIKTSGLMKGLYIDVRPGTQGSPPLGKNEELMGEDSFEIAKIGDMATEVVLEIYKILSDQEIEQLKTLEGQSSFARNP